MNHWVKQDLRFSCYVTFLPHLRVTRQQNWWSKVTPAGWQKLHIRVGFYCFVSFDASPHSEVPGSSPRDGSHPPCWNVLELAHLISTNTMFCSSYFALGLASRYMSPQGISKYSKSHTLFTIYNRSWWKCSQASTAQKPIKCLFTQHQNKTWDLPAHTPLHDPKQNSLSRCKQLSLLTTNEHQQRSPGCSEL